MRRYLIGFCALVFVFGSAALVPGADDDLKSGPQRGSAAKPTRVPGSFQCWMVTGKQAGRYHSPVCEHGLNPVVFVFTRDIEEADKPLTAFLKKVDDMIAKHPDARVGCCSVLLNDGGFRAALEEDDKEGEDFSKKLADTSKIKDELEAKLKEVAKTAEFKHVALSLDSTAGPKEYQLNPEAQITIVLYNKQVVLASHAFKAADFAEEVANKLAKEVEAVVLEVERLSRPMQKRR